MRKLFVFALGLIIAGIIIFHFSFEKRAKEQFNYFYSTNMEGKIEKIYAGGSGVHLTIKGEEFVFKPYTSELNGNRVFYLIAKVGDSISKPPFSDTLILINKKNEKISYTFQQGYLLDD